MVRARRWAPFLGYLTVHLFIVAGLVTPRFPDSASYMHLDFTGHALRLWTVPLFYRLLPTDTWRIAGQAVLAATAWWALSTIAAGSMWNRRARIGLRSVLLLLGVVGPISNWNSAILSESVAISLTALLIAAWLKYVRQQRWSTATTAVVATFFWTFARPPDVLVGVIITIVALVSAASKPYQVVRIAVAGAMVLISAMGFTSVSANPDVVAGNIADIVQHRVLTSDIRTAWFVEHGMPLTPAIAQQAGTYPATPLETDPDFSVWLRAHGQHVYEVFMFTHPDYTLLGPLRYLSGEEPSLQVPKSQLAIQPNPTPSLLSPTANYGRHRNVLPQPLSDLLFGPGQIGDVLALAATAVALSWLAFRRNGRDMRLLVPLCVIATVVPHAYVVWLLSGIELDRHALMIAVSIRVGLWLAAFYSADRLLKPNAPASTLSA